MDFRTTHFHLSALSEREERAVFPRCLHISCAAQVKFSRIRQIKAMFGRAEKILPLIFPVCSAVSAAVKRDNRTSARPRD
ncbi:MAG TPA: hypothetical protein DDX51_00375 [Clostridiales bacterium]|nr:hypothetical protein [Clostridiales bacterium]